MEKTIIPVGGNVVGNITDCKIENTLISIDKAWAGAMTQISTYRSYDVCSKQVIKDYAVQEITPNGIFLGLFVAIIVIAIISGLCSSSSDYPPIRY